jgi:integrase
MTVESYAKRFRQIVSDIFGLSNGAAKHDYRQGGQQKWLVQDWKRSCLAQAGDDSLALRKVRISVNSTMRQARSLFSRKMLRHLKLSLPDPLPFAGVDFEPRQSMKYRSEVDIKALVVQAEKDLSVSSAEVYKVFLLAIAVGLRRKEIDLLEWSSFRWEKNVFRVQPTRYFHPKSEDSIADLPVDAEVMNLFRRYHEFAKGPFVIRAKRPPLPVRPQQYYRCDPVFSTLTSITLLSRVIYFLRKRRVAIGTMSGRSQ